MTQVTIADAQQRLPELLSAVEAGESVTIRSDTGRTFTLAVQPTPPALNPDWPGYPLRKEYPIEYRDNEWTDKHLDYREIDFDTSLIDVKYAQRR